MQTQTSSSTLRPSLITLAEGYGYVDNGRVSVRFMDTKGPFTSDRYSVVDQNQMSAITGKVVPANHIKELSVETKSVRSALVRAVARRRAR